MMGYKPSEFDDMTPLQLKLAVEAYNELREEKRQLVYVQAALTARFVWAKRIPAYNSVFIEKQKEMSDDEMYEIVKSINKQLGGGENNSSS